MRHGGARNESMLPRLHRLLLARALLAWCLWK